jgi:Ca2+-binding RTX toxin-like protein
MTIYRITTKKKALKGSIADDSFFGSKFKDIFDGRSGDDSIYGAEGSDSLTGGDGNDFISSDAGSDKVLGGRGKDFVSGGLGNDRLYGGENDDNLNGEDGNDLLYGDAGADSLYGDVGNDKLYGGLGDDFLSGGDGNDRLDGGKGDDELSGGTGSDYLSGGAGDDTLYGIDGGFNALSKDRLLAGDGNDRVYVDQGDNALGGRGVDTLSFSFQANWNGFIKYTLDFSNITGKKAADIGYAGIKAGQFEKVTASVYDMDVGSVVKGSKGNDAIDVSGKSGVLNGGAGDDQLSASSYDGGSLADGIVVNGGSGDDKLIGFGNVTLVGGKGADQFVLNEFSSCTIADFSGKDYFLVQVDDFLHFDSNLGTYVPPVFDPKSFLVVGTDPKATTNSAQFVYDTDDGKLYYDLDGTGLNYDLELVAALANKAALKASSFVFIA